jgi:hypothetical protein
VIDRLARDLGKAFLEMTGLSAPLRRQPLELSRATRPREA